MTRQQQSADNSVRMDPREAGRDVATDYFNPWAAASQGDLPLLRDSLNLLNLSVTAVDDGQLYTLLHVASSNCQLGIMTWLLSRSERRRFVNAGDRDGDTALHYAGTVPSAQFLVETAQIDLSIQNFVGMTALEAKVWEVEAAMQEEHFSEENRDYVELRDTMIYLQSVTTQRDMRQ